MIGLITERSDRPFDIDHGLLILYPEAQAAISLKEKPQGYLLEAVEQLSGDLLPGKHQQPFLLIVA